jgi:ankyrin repeat protein
VCKGWRNTTKSQRWSSLAKDDAGQTAWHLATQHGYEKILEEIWVWDRKVQITPADDILLIKDKDGQTAWHSATRCVCKEILEHLWVWARNMHLNLKYDLLLSKNRYR